MHHLSITFQCYYLKNFFFTNRICVFTMLSTVALNFSTSNVQTNCCKIILQKLGKILHSFALIFLMLIFLSAIFAMIVTLIFTLFLALIFYMYIKLTCIIRLTCIMRIFINSLIHFFNHFLLIIFRIFYFLTFVCFFFSGHYITFLYFINNLHVSCLFFPDSSDYNVSSGPVFFLVHIDIDKDGNCLQGNNNDSLNDLWLLFETLFFFLKVWFNNRSNINLRILVILIASVLLFNSGSS